ncbi:MAG: LysE family translocator [Nitratireductor sp.]
MSLNVFLALAAFCLVSSITPGPNNLMLLASGVNHGFRQTIPHMLGISLGFAFLLACVGLGLAQVFKAAPMVFTALKFAGCAYLLYLAWKIANSGAPDAAKAVRRPMTFLEAAAFQWVNPKAWVMGLSAMTIYTIHSNFLWSVALIVVVFTVINLPSIAVWCGMGVGLRRFLADPVRLRYFNWTMAAMLVASLWPMLSGSH